MNIPLEKQTKGGKIMNREEMIFSLLQRRINTMFNGYACIEHGCLDGFPKGLNQMTNEELMNEYEDTEE